MVKGFGYLGILGEKRLIPEKPGYLQESWEFFEIDQDKERRMQTKKACERRRGLIADKT